MTASLTTELTWKQNNQVVTKVPNIVRMKENNFTTIESITEEFVQNIGVTTHQLQFMMAHQLKARSDMVVERAFDKQQAKQTRSFKVVTKVPLPRSVPTTSRDNPQQTPTSTPKEFTFLVKQNQSKPSWDAQTGGSTLLFANTKAKEIPVRPKIA